MGSFLKIGGGGSIIKLVSYRSFSVYNIAGGYK